MKRQLEEESDILKANLSAEEDDVPDTVLKTRLGKCEVCAATDARYACPKCEVKTCSLLCVQIHKKELSCDGIRDRTKFIPLRKMTKMDFMNDYYFLEECTRYVEDRKRDNIKKVTRYNKVLSTRLFRLRNAATERKISLRFLLENFAKHKENTTYLDWKLRKIFWRVEWIFVNACNSTYVDERCSEDIPLHLLLDKYLNVDNIQSVPQKKTLQYYQSVGAFGLKIFLKAEGIKRSSSRFYHLDAAKNLKENLMGKTIVEFPSIYLSYESYTEGFDIIDSDEDVIEETKNYQKSLDELHKKQLTNHKKTNPATNDTSDNECHEDDVQKLQKVLVEKRREERRRKQADFEKTPRNYLFADETQWDMLSTSDSENDEGNKTQTENDNND